MILAIEQPDAGHFRREKLRIHNYDEEEAPLFLSDSAADLPDELDWVDFC